MSKNMYVGVKATGCAAPDDKEYYVITDSERKQEWLAPRHAMTGDPKATIQALNDQGMPTGGAIFNSELLEMCRAVNVYRPREVLSQTGWTSTALARVDGEVFLPVATRSAAKVPAVGFYRDLGRYRCAGKLGAWKKRVAKPLRTDAAATFLIGLALAPVVRTLLRRTIAPFAVQIVTDQWRELRAVVLSVIGSANETLLTTDPVEKLLAKPARFVESSRDSLLVVGDINVYLAGEPGKKRPAAMLTLVNDHLLPSGGGQASAAGNPLPCVLFIEDRALSARLELEGDAAARLDEAILTIKLPFGALDGDRNGVERAPTPKRVWSGVTSAAEEHHGVALHRFQRRLVEHRGEAGPTEFRDELEQDFDKFLASVEELFGEGAVPDGMADLFALTCVALSAAERMGVLPGDRCREEAVWRVFRQSLVDRPRPPSAAEILTEVAARGDVRDIADLGEDDDKAELAKLPAFIVVKANGKRELWVPTDRKKETFDWRTFYKLPDFGDWYLGKGEKDRDGEKRRLGAWKTRVLRFRLPD